MKNKLATWIIITVICICAATVGLVYLTSLGLLDRDKNTKHVTCTVVSEGRQAAIGDVFIFNIDGIQSVKIQKTQCFNMNDVEQGDTFDAVEVVDDNNVLQCIVKVSY